jgi:hypothetical protein
MADSSDSVHSQAAFADEGMHASAPAEKRATYTLEVTPRDMWQGNIISRHTAHPQPRHIF